LGRVVLPLENNVFVTRLLLGVEAEILAGRYSIPQITPPEGVLISVKY